MSAATTMEHPVSWIEEKAHAELARVREARDKQVYPYFRQFERGGLHTQIEGKPVVNFSSNDYLGLTNHPKVKEAAKAAIDKYACGLSSSRPQATTTEHVELERVLGRALEPAFVRLVFEQPVDRHRLDAGRFAEPLGRAARRCRERDALATRTCDVDDRLETDHGLVTRSPRPGDACCELGARQTHSPAE